MPDIFVSYSRQDQIVARQFAEGFESEGFSVWWDQAISPGEAFDQVTEQALEEARAVVVLWSKTSVNSRWVRAEATQANANGRLVPVMIEPCRRPIIFELSHTVDLSHWQGDREDPGWKSFAASVRRLVERHAQATPSAAPAGLPTAPVTATPPAIRAATPSTTPAPPSYRESRRASPAKPGTAPNPVPPRRQALLYGASAVGIAAAGFAGGKWFGESRNAGQGISREPPGFQRLTFRRGLVRNAYFGPDGKTIYYGALWDGNKCRVYSTRIDNPESRALDLPSSTVLAVSKAGDLAISLGTHLAGTFTYGTLARVPISGGAPRELAENVKFADWSPDGSALAVIRRLDGIDRLEYPLGTVIFQPKRDEGTGLGFVRVAADGRRVAFVQYRYPQSLFGKLCVIEDGKVSVLTGEYLNIHGLDWRGDDLLYTASEDAHLLRALWRLKPGAAPVVIARLPVNMTLWDVADDGNLLIAQTDDRAAMIARLPGTSSDRDLSWLDASWIVEVSRDGKQVLFSETGQGVGREFRAYLRGIDGSPAILLGQGSPLALSPDARFALIRQDVDPGDATLSTLDIVPTGAGATQRLADEPMRHHGAIWMPDGRAIVISGTLKGKEWRIYRIDLPDGRLSPLTVEGRGDWFLSPDGATIAVQRAQPGLWFYPTRDDGAPRILKTTGTESLIGWIEDGLLVMNFEEEGAPFGDVQLLDPDTGRLRHWTNILPRDSAGIMAFVAFSTTPDGRVRVFTWHRALSNLYLATGL